MIFPHLLHATFDVQCNMIFPHLLKHWMSFQVNVHVFCHVHILVGLLVLMPFLTQIHSIFFPGVA